MNKRKIKMVLKNLQNTMNCFLLTCPDDDGIIIETMDENTLLEHIEEMDKEGRSCRFLSKIPEIVNGQFITKPFFSEEEYKKGWLYRSGIDFAVIIKGEIIIPNNVRTPASEIESRIITADLIKHAKEKR